MYSDIVPGKIADNMMDVDPSDSDDDDETDLKEDTSYRTVRDTAPH